MAGLLIATKFEGHKGPVLSLDYSTDHLLLSGSEDRTARIWDVRDSRRRASLCIPVQGEVLTVIFAPRWQQQQQQQTNDNKQAVDSSPHSAAASAENPFAKDHTIFLSMEHVVLEYDLRMVTGPIVSVPTRDLSHVLQNQDEVNQITATYFTRSAATTNTNPPKRKGKGGGGGGAGNRKKNGENPSCSPELFLAAADDAGTIRFMGSQSSSPSSSLQQSHILHHDPNGVAIVPACTFRPSMVGTCNKFLELASGGSDCKIHFWDLERPKRPISSYTIVPQPERSGDSNSSSKPQVCNPPMVYSLAWSPSGRLLAAGLGDGNIPIFSIENRTLVQTGYLPDGHDSSVASVLFPEFGKNKNERLVVSGGSDGSILCWDIGPNVMETSSRRTEDPRGLFVESFLGGYGSSPRDDNPRLADNGDGDDDDDDDGNHLSRQTEELSFGKEPEILFGIPHETKVNWMTTSDQSVFVADTSHDITAYQLPLL